jgi:hypothetical protein
MKLIGAEVLKLIRRRGLMIWSLLLTVGSVLIAEVVVIVLHAVNPAHHGPAGGDHNLEAYIFLATGLGTVAAIIIGATAGTQDVSNGVFRDLVVTGRSRSTLFNVRIPGALIVFLPMLALAYVIAIGGAFLFAGDLSTPSGSVIVEYMEFGVAGTALAMIMAIGLAAFASSRVVVGVLIAWNAIISNLLLHISALGSARKGIDGAAVTQLAPPKFQQDAPVHMSELTALLVILAWAAVFIVAGNWWTRRRDA